MSLLSSTCSAKEMARFCLSLGTLYEGGVPLQRALKAMEEQGGSYKMAGIARDLRQAIAQGATFSQAVHWHRKKFPPVFIHMTAIAEQSGSFGTMLPQLARYFDDLQRLYHGVIRQVAYPIAVLCAIIVGIPIIEAFLSDVAGIADAPFGTQLYWILRNAGLRAGGTFLAFVLIARLIFRYVSRESLLMYCWPLSIIIRQILIARFAWAMMVFTRTGMPLDHAIRLSGQVMGAQRMATDFAHLAPLIRQGHTLSEALAHGKFLPGRARLYIHIGETAGKLDESFEHLSRALYDEAMFKLRILIGIIEPIAILGLGALASLGLD